MPSMVVTLRSWALSGSKQMLAIQNLSLTQVKPGTLGKQTSICNPQNKPLRSVLLNYYTLGWMTGHFGLTAGCYQTNSLKPSTSSLPILKVLSVSQEFSMILDLGGLKETTSAVCQTIVFSTSPTRKGKCWRKRSR